MFLLVGLGNIGTQYQLNRHNIGFLAIDHLLKGLRVESLKKSKKSDYVEVKMGNSDVVILKPKTYMNNSGLSVQELMTLYKIPPNRVIVLVDDYDLPYGKIRIKEKSGSGTHNGLRSIETCIGKDYIRLRCGIFREHDMPLDRFVLSNFDEDEMKVMTDYLKLIESACYKMIGEGVLEAMNEYNNKSIIQSK